jgi:hypothetical protein
LVGAGVGLGDWVDAEVGGGVTLGRDSDVVVCAGAGGDGVREGEGEVAAGSVGEAENVTATVGEGGISTTVVGLGRTLEASSWLNRKLPKSIPMLMSVRTRLLHTCPVSVVWPVGSMCSEGWAVPAAWAGSGPNNWWALSPSRGCFTGLPRLTP